MTFASFSFLWSPTVEMHLIERERRDQIDLIFLMT